MGCSLQWLPLFSFGNTSITPSSCKQTTQVSNILLRMLMTAIRGSLVFVLVLPYSRPSCDLLQIMGFKLRVVSCLTDYNRSIGGWPVTFICRVSKLNTTPDVWRGALPVSICSPHPMPFFFLHRAQ